MKIIIHGPAAGYSWDGVIRSWGPDETVEIPDDNEQAVAWARSHGDVLEDAPPAPPKEPTLEELRAKAETLGLATYGSKAQLLERIASAGK